MLLGIIFVLVGGLMVLIALWLYQRTRSFLGTAQAAKARVIEMAYVSSSEGSGGYAPVYQFQASDGQNIVKQHGISSNPPGFKVGQEIDVLYEPANPKNARINKWTDLYFVPVLLGGMGLVFAVAGVAAAVAQIVGLLGR